MDFNENLKTLRKRNNLCQKDLAKMLGVKQYVISGWEIGRCEPSIKDLLTLSKIFKISLDKLLGKVSLDRKFEDEHLEYITKTFNELNKSQKKEIVLMVQSVMRLMKKEIN